MENTIKEINTGKEEVQLTPPLKGRPLDESRWPVPSIPYGWNTITNPMRGLRGYTYSHYSSDEVSSALQKGIRRGKVSESIKWAIEMFLMGPSSRTNVWNRIVVTSVEDIGPAEPLAVLKVWNLFEGKTLDNNDRKDDPYYLATAVKVLAEAKKSRINDWSAKIVLELRDSKTSEQLGTPDDMKRELIKSLRGKNAGASIYYEVALSFTEQKVTGRKRGRNYPMWLIWEAFNEVMDNNSYMKTLETISLNKSWKNNKKSRLLHLQIINLWCYDTLPDIGTIEMEMDTSIIEDVQNSYNRTLRIGIPDYAVDKHTRLGKRLGRGMTDFIIHGSRLENVDERWEPLSKWYYDNGISKTLEDPNISPIIGSYAN